MHGRSSPNAILRREEIQKNRNIMSGQIILPGSKFCWDAILCPYAIFRSDEICSMDDSGATPGAERHPAPKHAKQRIESPNLGAESCRGPELQGPRVCKAKSGRGRVWQRPRFPEVESCSGRELQRFKMVGAESLQGRDSQGPSVAGLQSPGGPELQGPRFCNVKSCRDRESQGSRVGGAKSHGG